MLTKAERLTIFLKQLANAHAASTASEAKALLDQTLNEVENEHTNIPFNPNAYADDGRLYPPQNDAKRPVPNCPGLVRYRNKGHNTYIAENGAIRIETTQGIPVFDKAGADGNKVDSYEDHTNHTSPAASGGTPHSSSGSAPNC